MGSVNRLTPQVRAVIDRLTEAPISSDEHDLIFSLHPAAVTYPVASPHKRFAMMMAGATRITDAQRLTLCRIVCRYRRQIEPAIVETARAMLLVIEMREAGYVPPSEREASV